MSTFIAALISGVALGFLLGLIGFGVVLLYKSTSVANFAQGAIGTLGAFLIAKIGALTGLGIGPSLVLGILVAAVLGAVFYYCFYRYNDEIGAFNLTIRTLGMQMLILALINAAWAEGQPFPFPPIFPNTTAIQFGNTVISWLTLGTICAAAMLTVSFVYVFNRTDIGLQFIAVAERPQIARMLGVRTRRLVLISWVVASVIALVVGTLLAPTALLSSEMMEPYMLLGFTAVVIGGLTSLYGVFIGGIIVGVVNNIASLYLSSDVAVLIVFCLLLITLRFRPYGLLVKSVGERL